MLACSSLKTCQKKKGVALVGRDDNINPIAVYFGHVKKKDNDDAYLIRLLQCGEASRRAFWVLVILVGMMDERETSERTLCHQRSLFHRAIYHDPLRRSEKKKGFLFFFWLSALAGGGKLTLISSALAFSSTSRIV
jgi:hypothetical protein